MSQHRIPTKRSKYYIEKELYLTVVHFCRQYPSWIAELSIEPDASKAITYDKERVQTSSTYDSTVEIAIRRAEIARKKALVEDTAAEISRDNGAWIILGVCYGLTFYQLEQRGLLIPRNRYYDMRREFYYQMAKKI